MQNSVKYKKLNFILCWKFLSVYIAFYRVGAGTAHGFGLLDYVQKKEVASRCTLNPEGMY